VVQSTRGPEPPAPEREALADKFVRQICSNPSCYGGDVVVPDPSGLRVVAVCGVYQRAKAGGFRVATSRLPRSDVRPGLPCESHEHQQQSEDEHNFTSAPRKHAIARPRIDALWRRYRDRLERRRKLRLVVGILDSNECCRRQHSCDEPPRSEVPPLQLDRR